MTTPPSGAQPPHKTGRLRRFAPLIGAGFLTGMLFGIIQAPDKSSGDWILIAITASVALVLWVIGIRRYAAPYK